MSHNNDERSTIWKYRCCKAMLSGGLLTTRMISKSIVLELNGVAYQRRSANPRPDIAAQE